MDTAMVILTISFAVMAILWAKMLWENRKLAQELTLCAAVCREQQS